MRSNYDLTIENEKNKNDAILKILPTIYGKVSARDLNKNLDLYYCFEKIEK